MLKNKIALITGAGRGIGRAIAIALAKEGAEVVINYNGSEERAKEVKQTIEENGGKASIYKCNVSDFAACEAMIKDIVKEYGHLDILVNNAGITKDGLLMKMSEEDFDAVLDTNLKGAFHTIQAVSRQMLKQRSGRIVNISSVVGVSGNAGQANYAASKAGIIGLTKAVAHQQCGHPHRSENSGGNAQPDEGQNKFCDCTPPEHHQGCGFNRRCRAWGDYRKRQSRAADGEKGLLL